MSIFDGELDDLEDELDDDKKEYEDYFNRYKCTSDLNYCLDKLKSIKSYDSEVNNNLYCIDNCSGNEKYSVINYLFRMVYNLRKLIKHTYYGIEYDEFSYIDSCIEVLLSKVFLLKSIDDTYKCELDKIYDYLEEILDSKFNVVGNNVSERYDNYKKNLYIFNEDDDDDDDFFDYFEDRSFKVRL